MADISGINRVPSIDTIQNPGQTKTPETLVQKTTQDTRGKESISIHDALTDFGPYLDLA